MPETSEYILQLERSFSSHLAEYLCILFGAAYNLWVEDTTIQSKQNIRNKNPDKPQTNII